MPLTKTARTLIASQSVAAGASVAGTLNLTAAYGARINATVTNGATGPTVAAKVYAETSDDGSTWRQWFVRECSKDNAAVTNVPFECSPLVMHLRVEVKDHTGQAVTVAVTAQELTSV